MFHNRIKQLYFLLLCNGGKASLKKIHPDTNYLLDNILIMGLLAVITDVLEVVRMFVNVLLMTIDNGYVF